MIGALGGVLTAFCRASSSTPSWYCSSTEAVEFFSEASCAYMVFAAVCCSANCASAASDAFFAASLAFCASAASDVRFFSATFALAASDEAAFLSNCACFRIWSDDWLSRLAVPRVESSWSVFLADPNSTPSEMLPPPVCASSAMRADARLDDFAAFAAAASAWPCSFVGLLGGGVERGGRLVEEFGLLLGHLAQSVGLHRQLVQDALDLGDLGLLGRLVGLRLLHVAPRRVVDRAGGGRGNGRRARTHRQREPRGDGECGRDSSRRPPWAVCADEHQRSAPSGRRTNELVTKSDPPITHELQRVDERPVDPNQEVDVASDRCPRRPHRPDPLTGTDMLARRAPGYPR